MIMLLNSIKLNKRDILAPRIALWQPGKMSRSYLVDYLMTSYLTQIIAVDFWVCNIRNGTPLTIVFIALRWLLILFVQTTLRL